MKELRIAIVGAGLAGLTMAYLLKSKLVLSKDVQLAIQLFEATNRVGGRVYTLRDFNDNLFAEAGALSICDNEKEILSLAKEVGIEIVERRDRGKKRYVEQGQWVTETDVKTIMQFLMKVISQLKQEKIISDEKDWLACDSKHAALDDLDKVTIIQFLRSAVEENKIILKNPDNLTLNAGASLLGLYTDNVSELSAWDALRFLSQYHETTYVNSVQNGNDQLPAALHRLIGSETVLLNTPVTQVEIKSDKKLAVTFKTTEDATKEEFFDYVVMAVPLTTLQQCNNQHILFKPPLPANKAEAIDHTPYNVGVARVYFETRSRFWESNSPDTAMAITDRETLWIEDHTAHLNNKKGAVLEAHASGPLGKQMLAANDPVAKGAEEIEYAYGAEFKENLSGKAPLTYFWNQQPYQQGTYPYFHTNQRKYIAELQKNVDNLFFIGEYTSTAHPASMNGAVQSAYNIFEKLAQNIVEHSSMSNSHPAILNI